MFCESYRETLNDAALSDERLPAEVQAHLASCASCRAAFSDEKALFALMDAEVRTRVSAEMPASLLPRVRQEIAASSPARTWRPSVLAYVTSGLVMGAIALSFAGRKVSTVMPEPSAHSISSPAPTEQSAAQRESGLGQVLVATNPKRQRPPRAIRNAKPEVLVSAEEELGLKRYAAVLRNAKAEAPAAIKGNTAAEIEPLQIATVDVKRLSIEPLQDGDSD